MDIRVAPNDVRAAEVAARSIATRLRNAVRQRGRASLALSGGGGLGAMFGVLAGLPVPWASVDIVQVDERVAPEGSDDRNATQLRDQLIDSLTTHRPRVHLLPVEGDDRDGQLRTARAVIERLAPLDVVHLGVGQDGHTASWPPGSAVPHAQAPVEWTPVFNGFERMTLTAGPVNSARSRIVLVTGQAKAPVVARWLAGDPALPVSLVRRGGTCAVLDEAAAALAERVAGQQRPSSRRPERRL